MPRRILCRAATQKLYDSGGEVHGRGELSERLAGACGPAGANRAKRTQQGAPLFGGSHLKEIKDSGSQLWKLCYNSFLLSRPSSRGYLRVDSGF
jgi:hypothetical protein